MKSLIVNFTIIVLVSVLYKGYAQGQAITWTNFVNSSLNGNNLEKTAGTSGVWDAGATSTSLLGIGVDGWVEFNANPGKIFMLGLGDTNPDASFQSIDYAIYNTTTDIQVWESGTWKHTSGSYQASDKFKIERVGSTIYYKKNDVVFYTSTVSSTSSLMVDVSINTLLAQIMGVNILFQTPQNPPTAPTSLVVTTVSGNRIDLSWTDNSSDESGFQIERSITSGTGYSIVHTTTSNEVTFSDNGLNSATQYFYRLKAINSGGGSSYTNEVSATTLGEGAWQIEGTTLYYNEGSVGIGTDNPQNELDVNGTIHAKEVKVDLNGWPAPDYVFEKDYPLTSLSDLKTYIEENKHLPEIPSAKEMEEAGINLKEMNMLLLKKVEELTLYILEQERRIKALENKQH